MEDDLVLAELLLDSLEAVGHSVTCKATGSEALAHYKEHGADLLVADVIVKVNGDIVPDGGVILTHRAKNAAAESGKKLPVIAISGAGGGHSGVDVLASVKGVGADATLEKPFTPKELLAEIDAQLAKTD
ncbi:MAG: response regulator [Pseudomonadota bacterium]